MSSQPAEPPGIIPSGPHPGHALRRQRKADHGNGIPLMRNAHPNPHALPQDSTPQAALREKTDHLPKLMISLKKTLTTQNLSTNNTQNSNPFPQLNAQHIVVDIVQIGYILCLLVLKAGSPPGLSTTGQQDRRDNRLQGVKTRFKSADRHRPADPIRPNRTTTTRHSNALARDRHPAER